MTDNPTITKTLSCMKLDEKLLISFGAEIIRYAAGDFIFEEEASPSYYYQILKGSIKENNYNELGNEFIQNILGDSQSFGDSFLFLNKKYNINAVALSNCEILRLKKDDFFNLIDQHPKISVDTNKCLSQRLYFKTAMIQNLASSIPEKRILGLLDYLKSFHKDDEKFSFQVKLTRQQIADLIGLRVETVIRTAKKLEKVNLLKIEERKIFY
ncbi:cAMP-binding domain of CRP or a regulatory subunit of cAMP-dependent protein kinases [Chryseobacterium piscicola]|uniref:cAMP-binding domain of CRP or a regulatory subunit of cAMP-dependent protein kinases n=2 Tax=Chryseobacterium piscicola TaxID=551459 RepID=A0A1N7LHH0_9FLAO|nr:cAMP-binding domain of CRP or a regulatory subunit of cAMP-dependent protein kinases [Chryseobacterium piscicola]